LSYFDGTLRELQPRVAVLLSPEPERFGADGSGERLRAAGVGARCLEIELLGSRGLPRLGPPRPRGICFREKLVRPGLRGRRDGFDRRRLVERARATGAEDEGRASHCAFLYAARAADRAAVSTGTKPESRTPARASRAAGSSASCLNAVSNVFQRLPSIRFPTVATNATGNGGEVPIAASEDTKGSFPSAAACAPSTSTATLSPSAALRNADSTALLARISTPGGNPGAAARTKRFEYPALDCTVYPSREAGWSLPAVKVHRSSASPPAGTAARRTASFSSCSWSRKNGSGASSRAAFCFASWRR